MEARGPASPGEDDSRWLCLHEEGLHRLLKGGDWAVSGGEGGSQMSEDMGCVGCRIRGMVRRLRGRTATGQCGADLALAEVEASP